MTLTALVGRATNKSAFVNISDYIDFAAYYLDYISTGLQARIISQNEAHYQFFQYKKEGSFNITRPINSLLMYDANTFSKASVEFIATLKLLREGAELDVAARENVVRSIYTLQQCIGAALDGLPSGRSNQARKVNGDLFERLIRLIVVALNVDCVAGTMQVPVKDLNGNVLFKSSYQHDLLFSRENELKIIGSVKTSSKDRLDKVFMDKFLYGRLTDTALPHIAIFLNDVQRKKSQKQNQYGISSTFLPGHFKAYSIKLNPLDGVYYCDIRPNMVSDTLLSQHIKTIDHFLCEDLWSLLNVGGESLDEVVIAADDKA